MNTWRFLDSGTASAAENMSVDEEFLRAAGKGGTLPVLRFYTWSPPAVSLGRFQDAARSVNAEVCRNRGIDIVRRITGGRAVLHHRELTYSIVCPLPSTLFPNDVLGSYRVIAECLLAGLRSLGASAEMMARKAGGTADAGLGGKASACFSTPSSFEILARGRKIIGSAQRRTAAAFLQHGSILLEYDPALEAEVIPGGGRMDAVTSIAEELQRPCSLNEIKKAFKDGFSRVLGIVFIP